MQNLNLDLGYLFSPISLEEMDGVSLLKRVDTKFVMSKKSLFILLEKIKSSYKVLTINSNKLMKYNTMYFDTPGYQFYLNHHNQRSKRTKIRIRKYVESDICFLEIKQKNNKGVLKKSRISIDDFEESLSENSREFIQKITKKDQTLVPSIINSFNRFTLVNKNMKERVTIDLNLAYNGEVFNPNLVIVELKQAKFDRTSPIVHCLKSIRINPFSISKYCIGMAKSNPNLKQNLFKHKILRINKI